MTESQWLRGIDGDAMLARVQQRLSHRKWSLLACGVARRLWEVFPEDDYLEAIRWREEHPLMDMLPPEEMDTRMNQLQAMLPEAIRRAEARQREILAPCDPDVNLEATSLRDPRRNNPAMPLFHAASTYALLTISSSTIGLETAHGAFQLLYTESGSSLLNLLRQISIQSLVIQTRQGLTTALAMEFKAEADSMTDQKVMKNRRFLEARANDIVHRKGEALLSRTEEIDDQKARADQKALGKLLLEQLGNPFQPYRFDPRWRTEAVVGLARSIDEDRRFELYPILLDALLEAECNDTAILGHVQGAEAHSPNSSHMLGCWVIDLILEKEPVLFAQPPLQPQPDGPGMPLGLSEDVFV